MKSLLRVARALALAVLLVPPIAAIAQEHAVRPEPAWLDTLDIPSKEVVPRASDGTRYLLLDDQIDTTGAKPHWYRRNVYALEHERALSDGGRFNVEYNPDYQRAELHAVDVLRDGRREHRLDVVRVQVLRREDELESGILDGRHTLNVTIPDLRVGDIVDYRFSVVGFNPIFGNAYYDVYGARYGVPIAERRVRATFPATRPLHWRAPKDYRVTSAGAGGRRSVDLRATALARVRVEDDVPTSFDPWGRVELTTAATWGDIVQWALPLYPTRFADRALAESLVRRLDLHAADKRAAMARAVAYVQGEIRYTALDMGQNSHAPYAPETTVGRRFGDCKDKASLLVALLAEAGIEAHPVLVNTEAEEGAQDYAPSAFGFDHVVVRARLDGRDVWIDGTRDTERGTFDARSPLPFGAGLPICAGCDAFVDIPAPVPAQPDVEVGEMVVLREDDTGYTADLTVVTDYRNERAVSVRDRFEDEGVEALADEYLEYMRAFYDGVTRIADPVVASKGEVDTRLTERYRVAWKREDADGFNLSLFQLNDYLPELADTTRRMPLALSGPRFARHTLRARNDGGWTIAPEAEVVENRYFRFTRTARVTGDLLVITGEWQRRRDDVPAADYAMVRADIERARDLIDFDIDLHLTPEELLGKERIGWPAAALAIVALAGFLGWRLRERARPAGMLFRPRATTGRVLASQDARTWAGVLLITLATAELLFGAGGRYLVDPSQGLRDVGKEWVGYFVRFAISIGVIGWGFRLLSTPIAYRNLFVATIWAVAPPLLIGYLAAIVAVGGDMALLAEEDAVFSDDRALGLVTAFALMLVSVLWAMYAAVASYATAANVSRGHALGATLLGMFAAMLLLVPLMLMGVLA